MQKPEVFPLTADSHKTAFLDKYFLYTYNLTTAKDRQAWRRT
ncbi:hypothetical protein [Paenibacillus stellifer]|nr:hypothetical protein [Paenibacillus stellifer]